MLDTHDAPGSDWLIPSLLGKLPRAEVINTA